MERQSLYKEGVGVYCGSTRPGEFPGTFLVSAASKYSSHSYGRGTLQFNLSDINHLIDALTEFRDLVDQEQAAESGDM